MGMDVYGKNADHEVGGYFRNNVWWWDSLARYIEEVAPKLASKCKHWHTNSGDGLNAEDSVALADILDAKIAEGHTAKYADNEDNHPFSVDNVEKFSAFLRECGGFAIW